MLSKLLNPIPSSTLPFNKTEFSWLGSYGHDRGYTMSAVKQIFRAVRLLALVVIVSGCYGTTDPATQIDATSARLHATGTCDTGDCDVYFDYWPADSSAQWGSSTLELNPRDMTPGQTESFFLARFRPAA